MDSHAQQMLEIKGILNRIPDSKLPEVKELLKPLASKQITKKTDSPKGIWAGKGFEKISDTLEEDLRELRKEASEAILRKEI